MKERISDGASFIFDESAIPRALWGSGNDKVLWSSGEGLLIAGPQSVGKSTLAQRIALYRIGVLSGNLLGMPLRTDQRAYVVYLAMDRPRQVARSFRRMVTARDRPVLEDSLAVWQGPPPLDAARNPAAFAGWIIETLNPTDVIVDSLKDLAPGLASDEVGANVNSALQILLAAGIEVVVLHHQRKASGPASSKHTIDEIYGSVWLTAGMGSVVMLIGQPGTSDVHVRHLKPPVELVEPLRFSHVHETGELRLAEDGVTLEVVLRTAGTDGITLAEAARRMYGAEDKNAQSKVRRSAQALEGKGLVEIVRGEKGGPGGGGASAWMRWRMS
jgi:hypothetical protein